MSSDSSFHYPPELLNLLIETIPLLNKSKKAVFVFFQGAGVSPNVSDEPYHRWISAPNSVTKYDITRHILIALNSGGDTFLRERREVLKRVAEFESFDACWENDMLKAKGCVAEVRKLTTLKDSVTKIIKENEKIRKERILLKESEAKAKANKQAEIGQIKNALFSLFALTDPHVRGKALEKVLNDLFKAYRIGIRDAFTLVGVDNEGIVEQIDGVIEFENHLYLIEMKWWKTPVGVSEISETLVRLFARSDVRGIIISASNFTDPAISQCRTFLNQKLIILSNIEELVHILDKGQDLKDILKKKIQAASLDLNPWLRV